MLQNATHHADLPATLPASPLLLTVEETSQAMRWSRTRTNAAIAANEIESYRDGKRRFVVAASLHDYIAKRRVSAKAA